VRIQRIQFLEKYAALAENLLTQNYGQEYTSEDVEKLAEALINMDVERAAEFERVEEIVKQARYTAKGFVDEIDSNLGKGSFQKMARYKSLSLINSLKKMIKGKSAPGTKALGYIDKGERKVRGFVKRDPLKAAGIGAGTLIAGTAGTALLTDND
jgi:hypothetical protein